MTRIELRGMNRGPTYRLTDAAGTVTVVTGMQFRCYVRFPRRAGAVEGIVDTGAPFTVVPERVWDQFVPGVDFEWLATDPPGIGRVLARRFTFRFARLLVPLAVEDYVTSHPRPGVIAQFTDGDPVSTGAAPIVLVGLWGGLLDDSAIRLSTDPATNRLAASLEFA